MPQPSFIVLVMLAKDAATLLAVVAGASWGVGEVVTKSVLLSGQVGPLTAIAVRSTVALPIIWWGRWWCKLDPGLKAPGFKV